MTPRLPHRDGPEGCLILPCTVVSLACPTCGELRRALLPDGARRLGERTRCPRCRRTVPVERIGSALYESGWYEAPRPIKSRQWRTGS